MRSALLPAAVLLLATASRAESAPADANGSEDAGVQAGEEHSMMDSVWDGIDGTVGRA